MSLLAGKTGLVMGIANDRSIATSVAKALHAQGARLGFSHLPDAPGKDRNRQRLDKITAAMDPFVAEPCDVKDDASISAFFAKVAEKTERLDFIVHSIAYAPTEDLKKATVDVSRAGFLEAMDVSVYSLLAVARHGRELMTEGGSLVTMTYFGSEKVLPGYNMMGVCKSALEASVRYLAHDLGAKGVRVNGVSAGPIKTLASSAVGDFKKMLEKNAETAPLGRNVTGEDVAGATVYLVSPLANGVTGETHHVDAGYNIMGA